MLIISKELFTMFSRDWSYDGRKFEPAHFASPRAMKRHCILTAICFEKTKKEFDISHWEGAGKRLGISKRRTRRISKANDLWQGGGPLLYIVRLEWKAAMHAGIAWKNVKNRIKPPRHPRNIDFINKRFTKVE